MALPKRRTSKSKKNSRRSHRQLDKKQFIGCSHCGSYRMPHRVCPNCGYYNDAPVTNPEGD